MNPTDPQTPAADDTTQTPAPTETPAEAPTEMPADENKEETPAA